MPLANVKAGRKDERTIQDLAASCPENANTCIDVLNIVQQLISNVHVKTPDSEPRGGDKNKTIEIAKVIASSAFSVKRTNNVDLETAHNVDGICVAQIPSVHWPYVPVAPARLADKCKYSRDVIFDVCINAKAALICPAQILDRIHYANGTADVKTLRVTGRRDN